MELLQEFHTMLVLRKGLSSHSVAAYVRDVKQLLSFLQKPPHLLGSIEEKDVTGYLQQMHSQYAPSSFFRKVVAIKAFLYFLHEKDLIEKPLFQELSVQKLSPKVPNLLSVDEVDRLLHAPDFSGFLGARDRAILELLYASGMRASECAALQIKNLQNSAVHVQGKGKKERMLPLLPRTIDTIDAYLLHRHDSEKALFISEKKQPIDRIVIYRIVRKYAKKIGLQGAISPHTLRHCYATHLLENGAGLRVIQELLGHEDIKTTDVYTHISAHKLQEEFHLFHPRP